MEEINYSSSHLFCKCTLDFHLLVPSRLNCLYMDCKAAHRDWSAGGRSRQYKMEDKCIQTAPASQIQNRWLHSSTVQIHIHLYLHCSRALSTLLYMCIWRGKKKEKEHWCGRIKINNPITSNHFYLKNKRKIKTKINIIFLWIAFLFLVIVSECITNKSYIQVLLPQFIWAKAKRLIQVPVSLGEPSGLRNADRIVFGHSRWNNITNYQIWKVSFLNVRD